MLDEDADGSGRQAADEGREPQNVDGDRPRFRLRVGLWTTWEDDGMGGIDEGRIDREVIELLGDLLEDSDSGIDRRRGLEEEIGLNVESREDRRVKTGLYDS